jgi:hypothetical protein
MAGGSVMAHRSKLIGEVALAITKKFTDEGRLIEAGWAAFAHLVIPKDASPGQYSDMQFAFMAGAEHLFSSIMATLDPGTEASDADMRRMDLIHTEITEWRGKLFERVNKMKGHA